MRCAGGGFRRLRPLELRIRDRVSVRVVRREAERLVDPFLQLLGEHVLESFGLVVDLVHVDAERLRQVELEQPVVSNDLERNPFSRVRQGDTAIGLVHGEIERRELFDHRAGRGRRDALALRQRGDRDATAVSAELVDLAQVVLDRVRQRRLSHYPTVCRLRHCLSRF